MMLLGRLAHYQTLVQQFERKWGCTLDEMQVRYALEGQEDFKVDDDILDWQWYTDAVQAVQGQLSAPLDDDLRPEYDETVLKDGVRGKYAALVSGWHEPCAACTGRGGGISNRREYSHELDVNGRRRGRIRSLCTVSMHPVSSSSLQEFRIR